MSTLKQQAARLPKTPGVYLFKNELGDILYVGKAKSLRDRARSYFAKEIGRGPGIDNMVSQAVSLEYIQAESEIGAILLEAKLIRQNKPRYNVLLRDDKSFALVRIDLSEEYPGVYLAREKDLETMLARHHKARSPKIRQQIDSQEFFGPYLSGQSVKQALHSLRRIWPFRDCSESKFKSYHKLGRGCFYANLGLCNAGCVPLVTPEQYRQNLDQIRMLLRGEQSRLIKEIEAKMKVAADEENYELAKLYRDRLNGLTKVHYMAKISRLVEEVRTAADLPEERLYNRETDLRIECYDISNNQGAYAVGAMITAVVAMGKVTSLQTREDLQARFWLDKSGYRKFKIKNTDAISDVAMLEEVLRRRLARQEKWRLPDLLVADGGLGQLSVMRKLVDEVVAIGTVAKGPTRKKTNLYGDGWRQLTLLPEELRPLLAEKLREEAHRFAIGYYRQRHRKGMLK